MARIRVFGRAAGSGAGRNPGTAPAAESASEDAPAAARRADPGGGLQDHRECQNLHVPDIKWCGVCIQLTYILILQFKSSLDYLPPVQRKHYVKQLLYCSGKGKIKTCVHSADSFSPDASELLGAESRHTEAVCTQTDGVSEARKTIGLRPTSE